MVFQHKAYCYYVWLLVLNGDVSLVIWTFSIKHIEIRARLRVPQQAKWEGKMITEGEAGGDLRGSVAWSISKERDAQVNWNVIH